MYVCACPIIHHGAASGDMVTIPYKLHAVITISFDDFGGPT